MALQFRRLLTTLTLLASLGCCYWSLRLGWADRLAREATPGASKKSLELAPGDSMYLQYAALLTEDQGGNGMPLRLRAAQLNPLDSWNWIQLATEAEMQNQPSEAEHYLLRAYDIDRQFRPRWALANFYLRRGDPDRALLWARKTLEFGGGDLNAVFQLCWSASSNGSEILDKSIPPRPEVLGEYLQYLDGAARLNEAGEVTKRLLPIAGADQEPALASYCTLALGSGNVQAGLSTWNGLIERGLIKGARVAPETGKSLVDPNFTSELTGIGFDWGIPPVEGVLVEHLPGGDGVRVVFSRNEPENCVILGDYIPLVPERKYRFRFRYETAGMSEAGLKWVIYDSVTKAVLLSAGAHAENSGEEQTVESEFQAPAETRLARIELRYEREPGTVRPEGSIRFSHLDLGFAR